MKKALTLLILALFALACSNPGTEVTDESKLSKTRDSSQTKAISKVNPEDSLNIILKAEPNNVRALLMRAIITKEISAKPFLIYRD